MISLEKQGSCKSFFDWHAVSHGMYW